MRVFSFSELRVASTCPWQWYARYVRHLQPKDNSPALSIGSAVHAAIADSYRSGEYVPVSKADLGDRVITPEDLQEADRVMTGYRPTLEQDLVEQEVLAVEWPFLTSVYTPRGTRSNYKLLGVVDLVTRDRNTGSITVWDHKTAAARPSGAYQDLQLGLYSWALWSMGAVIHKTVQNTITKTKKVANYRMVHFREPEEMRNWGWELYTMAKRLPRAKSGWASMAKNPQKSCAWMCSYPELCRLSLEGRKEAFEAILEEDYTVNDSNHRATMEPNTEITWAI